jgi:hypothetical protein
MRPTELIVRNYRSFAGEHRVELRPLTLLFGDNSAGKSALARALPLLADAAGPYSKGPLPLDSAALGGSGFRDLRFKGQLHDGDGAHLGLGLGWGPEQRARSVVFELDREFRRIQVRRLQLEDRFNTRHELVWVPRDEMPPRYEHNGAELTLSFAGLVPTLMSAGPDLIREGIDAVASQLSALHRRVQWIEATRLPTPRRSPQPAQPFTLLRPDGGDAAQLAFADDAVRRRVSSWFERNLGQELTLVEAPPDELRTFLQRTHDPRYDVDLLDAGQGAVQVFPVLVGLATLAREDGPRVLVVEEPESHLHAELQHELAREIAVAVDPQRVILVETHSRPFFLGVQLEIIKGNLRPQDVIIHSVRQESVSGRSYADRVEMDADGMPSSKWPPNFFSSDAMLAREVLMARQARARSSS